MLKLLHRIVDLLSSFLSYKFKKEQQELSDKKQEKKQEKQHQNDKNEAARAVFDADINKINIILNTAFTIITLFCLSGCITNKEIVYVESDREVKTIVYEGKNYYLVPYVIMNELIQAKIDCKYYKEKYESIKASNK